MPLDFQLNTTVIALQGRPVADNPPADGQVLTWDNTAEHWTPAATSIPDTVFNFQGAVATPGDLPASDQATGDTYYVTGDQQYWFWDGTQWTPLAPPINTVSFPEAPADGQIYGRDGATTSWEAVLALSGGTLTGSLILNGPPTAGGNPDQAATMGYVDSSIADLQSTLESQITSSAQFLGTLDAPVGEVFYNPQAGISGNALVPASQVPGAFVICINAGMIPASGPGAGTALLVGDWLYSDGTSWIPINVAGTGSGGGGGITNIVAGTGLTGGGSTPTVNIALTVPVALANGGTGSTSAAGALDSLTGSSGSDTGLLQRATNGVWSLVPGGGGGAVDATQVALNPGINSWTTVQEALEGINDELSDYAPIDSPVFTGTPEAPNPAAGSDDQQIATTSWVNATIAAYVSNWAASNGVLTDVTTSGDVTST